MHIAVIGCGQLSRMLALAGLPLGIKFSFVADTSGQDTVCVDGLGAVCQWLPEQSVADLYEALGRPDIITVEKEQLDLGLLEAFEQLCPVSPSANAVAACKHRFSEKQILTQLGIPTTPYISHGSGSNAIAQLGLPLVAKSCTDGYDGKSQWRLKTSSDVAAFFSEHIPAATGTDKPSYIVEQMIAFERELSQVSVRDRNGNIAHYALTENHHANGILERSIAPAPNLNETLIALARDYISRVMNELDYIGVMAIEFFQVGDKQLMVNEMAPRVHNSGHWTQSGSFTSQFENHIRAIAGLNLGDTSNIKIAGMVNLIGTAAPPASKVTASSTLHWYNKAVRAGRKLGHMNFVDDSYDGLAMQMEAFRKTLV